MFTNYNSYEKWQETQRIGGFLLHHFVQEIVEADCVEQTNVFTNKGRKMFNTVSYSLTDVTEYERFLEFQ